MDVTNKNSLTADPTAARYGANRIDKAPKFVRSKDRCHIITRTPIYDINCNLLAYNFRFTAGEESFRPDQLLKKHVKHVLIGFFIRRPIDDFTQQSVQVMTELPLTNEISKFSKPLPANRFILHLQDRQDSSASFQHQVNMLRREAMTIACDVYTIVYTNWFTELRSISYAVIDMTLDIEEQFILAKNIVKKAPWIKIICDRCDTLNKVSIAFEAGANYVCAPTFTKDTLKAKFNAYHYKYNKQIYNYIPVVLSEILENRPNYQLFFELLSFKPSIKTNIPFYLSFIQKDIDPDYIFTDIEQCVYDISTDALHKLICLICLDLLEEFYLNDNEINKFLAYEPVKQILIRAKFIEELLANRHADIDISWAFTLGLCSNINLLYPYSIPETIIVLNDISAKIANLCRDEKLFGYALRISQCLESLDLGFVDKIIESEVFSRHEILFAYENSLMWLSSFIEYTTTKRY